MKKVFLACLTTCAYVSIASAQCCPYVDQIEILPASPLDTDSIYVVTNVTTPNMGDYLGYTIIDQGTTIRIEACYYSGMLTALESYTDTINLGLLAGGMYNIVFVAYQTGDMSNCIPTDSNEVSGAVTVTSTLGLNETPENNIIVYPNPVQSGTAYITGNTGYEIPFRIVNTLGQTVLEGTTGKAGEINVSDLKGVFFISLLQENGVITKQIWVE